MKKHFHFQSEEPDHNFNCFDLPTIGALFALLFIYILIVGFSLIA